MADSLKKRAEKKSVDKFIDWIRHQEDATHRARELAQRDRDYYDGHQWTQEERRELERRGQPCITVNRIAQIVDVLVGEEIRKRVDPKALPHTVQHDDEAFAVTDALRYVDDNESVDQKSTQVFKELVIEGWSGGVVVEVDSPDANKEIPVRIRRVPWDRFRADPHSREIDYSDARWLAVETWWDLDDAISHYGEDKKEALESARSHSSEAMSEAFDETYEDRPRDRWFDPKRNRIRVAEMYYREGKDWYTCHLTKDSFIIEPRLTGYIDAKTGHHECPLIAVSAKADRNNNRYGWIRHLISPQDEINHRRSRFLHMSNVRTTTFEEGAIADPESMRQELAKADGQIIYKDGYQPPQIINSGDLAQGQVMLYQDAKAEIEAIGPQSKLAASMSASSGRDRLLQQSAGSIETESLYDAMASWRIRVFESIWNRIRQFWTEEKWLRVRDEREDTGYRFTAVNRKISKKEAVLQRIKQGQTVDEALQGVGAMETLAMLEQMRAEAADPMLQQQAQEEGIDLEQMTEQILAQSPELKQPLTINDVARIGVDISIDIAPETANVQAEEFERIAQIGPAMAQAGQPFPIEFLIEASQLRNKKRLLAMMQEAKQSQAQAQSAQQEAMQGQIQMQMQQMQIALQQSMAELQKTVAEVKKVESEAMENEAHAAKYAAEAAKDGVEVAQRAGGAQVVVAGQAGDPLAPRM